MDTPRHNFYPRPPRGGRPFPSLRLFSVVIFLSTPSARRATWLPWIFVMSPRYFYPRPPRGGRRAFSSASKPYWAISIHALREEGDAPVLGLLLEVGLFLSTPSARRATTAIPAVKLPHLISIHALREEGDASAGRYVATYLYFYPRPPRGGRLLPPLPHSRIQAISIHALREEGDFHHHPADKDLGISIHALREEGDSASYQRDRRSK